MNASELKKWLAARGCTFETHKGGSGHLTVRRGDLTSQRPMHGSGKELGVGIRSQQDQERSGIELMAYRIVLTPDTNDTFLAECPAFPEVVTFGETEEDAKRHASLAIQEAIARRMHDGQDVPPPDGAGGATEAPVPLLVGLQVDLYRALRESGLTRAELARRLGWNRNSVDRLFDVNHASRLEQIEAALGALGYRIDARLTPA